MPFSGVASHSTGGEDPKDDYVEPRTAPNRITRSQYWKMQIVEKSFSMSMKNLDIGNYIFGEYKGGR